MDISRIARIRTTEDHADLVIMFPVTAETKTFSLSDNKGMVLKTVELGQTKNHVDWNCTPDYSIFPQKETGGLGNLPVLVIAGVIVPAIAGGAG